MKLFTSLLICMSMSQAIIGVDQISPEDFLFYFNEGKIVVDYTDSVNDILNQLGEPADKKVDDYEHFSHVRLQYGFLEIGYSFFNEASLEKILGSLATSDPGMVTNRGISVGDNIGDVIFKYGEPYFQGGPAEERLLVYSCYWVPEYRTARTGIRLELNFVLNEDGAITSIHASYSQ